MSVPFEVQAHFYSRLIKNRLEKFRSQLEIRRHGSSKIDPDLIVIMLNPAEGHSKDARDEQRIWDFRSTKDLVPADFDATSAQIARLMDTFEGLDFVRVVNLTDLRDPDDAKLQQTVRLIPLHSLFCEERRIECEAALGSNKIPVLLAWGVRGFTGEKKRVLDLLEGRRQYGIPWKKSAAYLNPWPRTLKDRMPWLVELVRQFRLAGWKRRSHEMKNILKKIA